MMRLASMSFISLISAITARTRNAGGMLREVGFRLFQQAAVLVDVFGHRPQDKLAIEGVRFARTTNR